MIIFERIQNIRKYRNLTQETVASWFNLSKQSWSRKERGIEGGFGPEEILTFLNKTSIDARYLFNQIDKIEDADLKQPSKKITDYSDLVYEINTLKDKVTSVQEKDPIAYRVSINNPLRSIAEKLQFLDAAVLEKIETLVMGYLASMSDSNNKKESAAG